jgi:RimJ/RimL family protein N-acetyltransferase
MMQEALTAVISFAFRDLRLRRIEANPLARNTRSRELLVRLAFREEGVLRKRVLFRGEYLDQVYYGQIDHEWRS